MAVRYRDEGKVTAVSVLLYCLPFLSSWAGGVPFLQLV